MAEKIVPNIDPKSLNRDKLHELISNPNETEESKTLSASYITGWDEGYSFALSRIYGIDPEINIDQSERFLKINDYMNEYPHLNLTSISSIKYLRYFDVNFFGKNENFIHYMSCGKGIINDNYNIRVTKPIKKIHKFFFVLAIFLFNFTMLYAYGSLFISDKRVVNVDIFDFCWLIFLVSSVFTFVQFKLIKVILPFFVKDDPLNMEATIRLAKKLGINTNSSTTRTP